MSPSLSFFGLMVILFHIASASLAHHPKPKVQPKPSCSSVACPSGFSCLECPGGFVGCFNSTNSSSSSSTNQTCCGCINGTCWTCGTGLCSNSTPGQCLSPNQCPGLSLSGKQFLHQYEDFGKESFEFKLCGQIHGRTCGSDTSINQCAKNASGCCGVCQHWADETEGACLGTEFIGATVTEHGVDFYYINGDYIESPAGYREAIVNVKCGSTKWNVTGWTVPTWENRTDGDPYVYIINATSNLYC